VTLLARHLRAVPSWQITLGVALLGLGFLVAAQLASEGPRIRYTTQERSPLVETVNGLQGQQGALKDRILALRTQIQQAEQRGQGSAAAVRQINDDLARARIAGGLVPLKGPGVVFELQDSVKPASPGRNDDDYRVSARDIRTAHAISTNVSPRRRDLPISCGRAPRRTASRCPSSSRTPSTFPPLREP
jgi:uncharacterized protein YlxW (UPF0749 family)